MVIEILMILELPLEGGPVFLKLLLINGQVLMFAAPRCHQDMSMLLNPKENALV